MKQVLLALFAVVLEPMTAFGQTPGPVPMNILEQSSEYRFQLVFHVDDEALAKLLPDGWVETMATQGPAKDVNMRVIFIDAGNITGPDNKPLVKGRDLMVIFAAPVKKADGSATGQMILGGIDQNDPGAAFGVLDGASSASVTRSSCTASGITTLTEDWDLAAGSGAHVMLHAKFHALPANHASNSANYFDPADPKNFQIFRAEQTNDALRNITTSPPDRVLEYLSGTRLVRAFNTIGAGQLIPSAHRPGELIGVPVAADDQEALKIAAQLVRDAGFEPIIVGRLSTAKQFDDYKSVHGTAREIRAELNIK